MERTCRNGINCWNEKCSFKHPVGWKVCKISCHVYNCNYAHPPQRKGPCKSGASCFNPNCEFLHPLGWTVCSAECINKNCEYAHPPQRNENNLFSEEEENCYQEEKCIDYDCPFSHPPQRKAKCFSGSNCYKYECEFLHPHSRFLCDGSCILFECNKIHPSSRNKPCLSKENCYNLNCKYLHPKYRKQPCKDQEDCKDFYCDKLHPPNRTNPCTQGKTCVNLNCELLHPECKLGIECFDFDCTFRHPHGRTPVCPRKGDCPDMDCEYLHPLNWDPTSKKLKTQYERDIFRNINKLPILNSKDLFIQRLKKEKVLVVTAETGSGKTTQLPQYAAESFQGKVVCTQPRALAAISIAQRIADEFDGSSPGENVGYKVGGKAISGRRIELMTDSNLVNKAQSDPQLSDVSVLIIDEAHERSLFTDIVIGIARLVLKERPNDFYVVIASATIDPKPFLDYFFGSNVNSKPFEVPGRTYPVTVEYNEVLKDEETQNLKSILIPEVVKIMNKYSEGNCLVFLPGSKEIDTAIVEFCNKKKENWIPFPLYGSLPPEAQASVMSFDDNDGKLRMIVFCTNIAETSLTVPNIRVVIDTGLAKEARYDPKRRITVLEQVFISKSSAEQRKGRAGRTAPGNCIRLYSEQKLTRANIEPEILRSSLDLVVLQLKNLNYDPLNFPFLSAPKQEFLQNSIQLLTQFECLDLKQMITKRGKLFSDFPFDPRMSNFIITAQEKFGQGETVTQIVSILTAPGSIFFMGSAKDRKEIKGRIATAASKFNSDLLFLLDTYRNWLNSGSSLVNNKCINCKRVTRKRDDSGCKFCRTQFAVENGLNNKIVEIVRSTELKAKEKLPSSKSPLPLTPLSEVIGYCLLSSFKEQICENLIANNPDAGVYLFDSGGKGTFSTTSALAQKMKSEFEYFIAMSITQLSKDLLIIDQGHPIHTNWIPKDFYQKLKDSSLQVQECYSKPNVNKSFRKYVSEALQNNGEQYSKFTLVLYDNAHTTLRVFGPRDIAKEIKNICETAVSAKLKQEIEKEMTCELSNRIATATVNAGLKIIKVQFSEDVNEVRFIKPPVKNSQELKQWISEKARIPESFIKSCVYYSKSINYNFNIVDEGQSYGIAIFTSKDAANRALTLNNEIKEISIGLKVLWRLSKYISQEEAQKYLHDNSFFPSKFDSFPKFSIKINNFPPDNKIESNLKKLPLNQVGQIRISKTNTQSWIVNILFNSKETRDKALQILHNFSLVNQDFSITTKYGKQKRITPEIIPVDKPSEFTLEFKTITETENFLNNFHYPYTQLLECQATTRVHYPQLYNLDTIGALIAEKYEVRYFANKKEGVAFVTFAGKEPKKCNQAVQAFSSSISPIYVFLGTRKQQLMITELQDLELIDKFLRMWSKSGITRRSKDQFI